jgi:hypothetical protein
MHCHLGHISVNAAKKLAKDGLITGLWLETTPLGNNFFCESCVYAKATRKPVANARSGDRATEFGGEVHSDLWGPVPVATKGRKCYYIMFVDDSTQFAHLNLLAAKSEAQDAYKTFEAWCETQMKKLVRILHSDHGGEYMGKGFVLYLKSKGTEQKLPVHNIPQENGVAERHNRTIIEGDEAGGNEAGGDKGSGDEGCMGDNGEARARQQTATTPTMDDTPPTSSFASNCS